VNTGTIVGIHGNSVSIIYDDGTQGTRSVTKDCKVTLDGVTASLADLKAGDRVTFRGDPATSIKAHASP
jgi:hypothetical protein